MTYPADYYEDEINAGKVDVPVSIFSGEEKFVCNVETHADPEIESIMAEVKRRPA